MIRYFSRRTKAVQIEKVYGNTLVDLAYKNSFGLFLTNTFLPKKILSKLMGAYQNSPFSIRAIKDFVSAYEIDLNEYEDTKYSSFNDFFIRKFKKGARSFSTDENIFCAGAEARYLAVENIQLETQFPVKKIEINLTELLGSEKIAREFIGGTLIIARLCPVDYHRYHFPISGEIIYSKEIHGGLHSVNPVALAAIPKVLFQNERHVAILKNELFGKVAMIEVGALGVGKIIQSHQGQKFEKGQEKGYFLFGGSTVIWVLQSNSLQLDADLALNSVQGLETWIPLGDRLGERNKGASRTGATNY